MSQFFQSKETGGRAYEMEQKASEQGLARHTSVWALLGNPHMGRAIRCHLLRDCQLLCSSILK